MDLVGAPSHQVVGKATRTALLEQRQEAQSRLDKLHELVQQGARRSVADTNKLLSEMQSLRFDGAVTSARRQRALAQADERRQGVHHAPAVHGHAAHA